VRLARPFLKLITVLAIVAVAFGGAVALASTLFEGPPKDAADFAARVEAGSEHAKPPERSTAAERGRSCSASSATAVVGTYGRRS